MPSDTESISLKPTPQPGLNEYAIKARLQSSGTGTCVCVCEVRGQRMGKYFYSEADIKSSWQQVLSAFWQRYPNPFSTHVLTEDVLYREVTPSNHLLSRRLLTKTNRLPRWAERVFPAHMARAVYILEDSIVDPQTHTLITKTWNLNHTTLMSVVERCIFEEDAEQPSWTRLKREAWISSGVYGLARPIQEFGLARFKSNQTKAMKGLEYALSRIQREAPPRIHADQGESPEKTKPLPPQTTPTTTPKPQQFA